MAASLMEDETGAIMWPLLQAALTKCRVQKPFPCKAMFGTKQSQGINIPGLSVIQTVQDVQAVIQHGHQLSPSRDLHLHNMEAVQCHLGSEIPFWELPFELHGGLAPVGWTKSTWQHLSPTSLTLRGPSAMVAPKHLLCDGFVMDVLVHKDWTLQSRRFINEIRLHLGGTMLSGTHIDPWTWKGKQWSQLVQTEVCCVAFN